MPKNHHRSRIRNQFYLSLFNMHPTTDMLLLMDFTFIMSVTNEKEIKCWTISTLLILLANSVGSEPQITDCWL